MTTRGEIVRRWRSRLADNEALLASGSGRLRWLRRMYVRLYRFLIACYGSGSWRADATGREAPEAQDGERSRMPFVDNTADKGGLQPKSPARIRATLKKLHEANDPKGTQGRLARGLDSADWIAVSAQTANVSTRRCVRLLRGQGIEARAVRRGNDCIVEVRVADYEEAITAIDRNRKWLRPRKSTTKEPLVWAAFGAFGGITAAAVAVAIMIGTYPPRTRPSDVVHTAGMVAAGLAVSFVFTILGMVIGRAIARSAD